MPTLLFSPSTSGLALRSLSCPVLCLAHQLAGSLAFTSAAQRILRGGYARGWSARWAQPVTVGNLAESVAVRMGAQVAPVAQNEVGLIVLGTAEVAWHIHRVPIVRFKLRL